MKKNLRNALLTILALSTGIAFSQNTIIFDSDSGNGTSVSGVSVIQTIDHTDGSTYVLTATHTPDNSSSGSVASLWDLGGGDEVFYCSNTSVIGAWTINLTKDGASQTFTFNQIDFISFSGSARNFIIKNDSDDSQITTINIPANGSGSSTIATVNNTGLSSFTITAQENSGTQLVDFHNISITVPSASLGVEEKDNDSFKVIAAPNPTTDEVTIKFNNAISTENEFNVLDVNGRLIKSQKSSKLEETIDLSSFKSGVYFVKISNGKNAKTLRLIKK